MGFLLHFLEESLLTLPPISFISVIKDVFLVLTGIYPRTLEPG